MLFADWKVCIVKLTLTEVLKMLPEATSQGQHFQVRCHSFSPYGPTPSRKITYLFSFFLRLIGL